MKLPLNIQHQVPEFVRAEHPAFVEFIKAYYTWYEDQFSIGKIEHLVDIDDTVDDFVRYFKKELDVTGILHNIDDRLYLKHIKELYAAKGSSAAFGFLFKILFNKESTVIHPWDYVFKPSDGKWHQDTSIMVDYTAGDPTQLVGQSVYVVDSDGAKYATFVSNVVQKTETIYETFIDRFSSKNTEYVSVVARDGAVSGTTVRTITSAKIQTPGSGFQVGQVFNIESYGGVDTVIKVKEVGTAGELKAVQIIAFGLGYETSFNAFISSTQQSPAQQTNLNFSGTTNSVPLNLSYQSPDQVTAKNDRGLIVKHNYTSPNANYLTDLTYVGKTVGVFKSQPTTVTSNDGSNASILFELGYILKYPGYYTSSQNIIGDEVYIEDSYYYQVYSYVTSLDETVDQYSSILKKTLHPTGTKHFGRYLINNALGLSITVEPSLNIISKGDALRDFANVIDTGTSFAVDKVLNDVAISTDVYDRVVQFNRSFEDTVSTSTSQTFTAHPRLDDTATTSDGISIVPGIGLAQNVVTSSTLSFGTDKYTSDSIVTSNTGALYGTPLYTEVLPSSYWVAGYLENERTITN